MNKTVGRPFQKGQSGNPTGKKPIDPAFKKLLETKQEWALKALIDIAEQSEDDAVRLKAIQYIIDRHQGKPGQAIMLSSDPEAPFQVRHYVDAPRENRIEWEKRQIEHQKASQPIKSLEQ